MNKLINSVCRFMPLWYILTFTWGIISVILGSIVALFAIVTGHKPKRFGPCVMFVMGKHWGGLSLSPFIFVSKNAEIDPTKATMCHEFGHTLQNCILGPLVIFFVYIPSAVRYWIYWIRASRGLYLWDYYGVWFERTASECGTRTALYLKII